jgi:putative RecB family exonuclease
MRNLMATAALADQSGSASDAGEGVQYHSFSSVNQWSSICSLQYFFQRILRLPKECVSAALILGIGVNDALRAIDVDLMNGLRPDVAFALQVLRTVLEKAFADKDVPVVSTKDETLQELYEKGRGMVEYYVTNLPNNETPVDLPHRFMVPLLDEKGEALPRPLVGEIDRWVKTADGRIGVVDWKTAAARWPADKLAKDDQATAYLLAGETILGRSPDFFRYDLLLKTKKPEVERYYVDRTLKDRKRLLKKVRMVDRALQAGVFTPNDTSFACPTCAFQGACSRWQD